MMLLLLLLLLLLLGVFLPKPLCEPPAHKCTMLPTRQLI